MNIYGEFQKKLCLFRNYLLEEERSAATIEKYGRDVLSFLSWLSDREEISKEVVVGYKQAIIGKYKTTSANSMLVSVNRFLDFIGKKDCQVKLFKIQRNPFRKKDKELTKEEYNRLILAAKAKSSSRLFLMIQAICSTGIRVSEHRFITREALERGRITIYNKGKERVVFLPKKLKKCLLQYCRQNGIYSGPVFVTKNGTPVNRCNVWAVFLQCLVCGIPCLGYGLKAGKGFRGNDKELGRLLLQGHLADDGPDICVICVVCIGFIR